MLTYNYSDKQDHSLLVTPPIWSVHTLEEHSIMLCLPGAAHGKTDRCAVVRQGPAGKPGLANN